MNKLLLYLVRHSPVVVNHIKARPIGDYPTPAWLKRKNLLSAPNGNRLPD